MKYLQRQRILGFFIIVLGLLALGWFWYFSPSLNKGVVYENGVLTAGSINKITADTDGDGLQDWEEALWKTDPKKPDSDGDGILDGDETKRASDLKASPSEELPEEPNLTEAFSGAFARSIGPRILEEGGLSGISATDLEGIAGYLPSPDSLLPEPEKLTSGDIIISDKNDSAEVKEYFSDLFSIYQKTFFALKEDDLTILERTFREENFKELEKIDSIIAAFDKSFAEVKKLPVPRGWENFALTELAYLARTKQILEKMRSSASDPLVFLILLPKRVETMQQVRKFHQETGTLLAENGIIFKEGESAYQLFQ